MTQSTVAVHRPLVLGRTGVGLAIAAAVAAFTQVGYHLSTEGPPGATFGSFGDWLRDGAFLVYLIASIGALLACQRAGLAPRAVVILIGVGYAAIAVGVAISLVLQEDPAWFFPVLGGPGNLLALAGFVTWGVVAFRRRLLPAWAAVWCTLGGLVAVLGAELGTSAVIGSFWVWMALRRGPHPRG